MSLVSPDSRPPSLSPLRLHPSPFTINSLDDLPYSAKESLHGWVEKYKYYKCYPVVGRLVTPPLGLKLTTAELAKHKGDEEKEGMPEGWAAAPIYVAVKGNVFDMSFGGRLFYGPGGPYHFLAGKDGSRPLAKVRKGNLSYLPLSSFHTHTTPPPLPPKHTHVHTYTHTHR